MKTYLNNLIEEKGLTGTMMDVDSSGTDYIAVTMQIEDVIEFILTLPKPVQAQIRTNLVKIDFLNGDVLHFLNYIANGMVRTDEQLVKYSKDG